MKLLRLLQEELANFQARAPAAGGDSVACREGPHDDLVLAVAVACWQAEWDPSLGEAAELFAFARRR